MRLLGLTCVLVLFANASARVHAQTQATSAPASRAGEQRVRLPPGRDQVTIKLSRAGPLLLTRGIVNGQDIGWLAVDTGASGLLLDPAVADGLKLPAVVNAKANGIAGTVDVVVRACDTLALGGGGGGGGEVVVARPIVIVSQMPGLSQLLGFKLAGLLGGDVLGETPCAIDFRDDTLTFYNRATFKPPSATQPHRMRVIREIPHIRGTVEGREGWFVIDTGSMQFLSLDTAFVVLHRDLVDNKPLMPGVGFGIGGQASDYSTLFSPVRFLGHEWRDVEISFLQSISGSGTQAVIYPSGRIGVKLMGKGRLTVDYANANVWLEHRDGEPEALEAYLARIRERAGREVTRMTALMMASADGRADAVRALLDEGADPNAAEAVGFTALMYAADSQSAECAAALLAHKANPNAEAAFMALTPLVRAAEAGSAEVIELLLKAGAKPNALTTAKQSALLRAVQRGSTASVAALLAGGGNPSLADKTGGLPLTEASKQGNLAMINNLLDHGADIEAHDRENLTALSSAAYARRVDAVKLLLSRGASARAPYSEALHAAAAADSEECIQLLLAAGANIDAKDSGGRTAIEIAARQGGVRPVRILLNAGARTAATTTTSVTTRPAN